MAREQTSQIGPSLRIVGSVTSDAAIEVRGRVEGAVTSQGAVSVEAGAQVTGGVRAASIRVRGEVAGPLHADDEVGLERGATVRGDVRAARLRIEDGAIYEGRIEMPSSEES